MCDIRLLMLTDHHGGRLEARPHGPLSRPPTHALQVQHQIRVPQKSADARRHPGPACLQGCAAGGTGLTDCMTVVCDCMTVVNDCMTVVCDCMTVVCDCMTSVCDCMTVVCDCMTVVCDYMTSV